MPQSLCEGIYIIYCFCNWEKGMWIIVYKNELLFRLFTLSMDSIPIQDGVYFLPQTFGTIGIEKYLTITYFVTLAWLKGLSINFYKVII